MKSLSIFVGTAACNAKCAHCAGIPHRTHAPHKDFLDKPDLVERTMRECYAKGARNLSISSSGEPTLSPVAITTTMFLVNCLYRDGLIYNPINLYSNGIRIGTDAQFCKDYLGMWRGMGLSTVYVTVHSTNSKENAKIYGVKEYPPIDLVIWRLHEAGLKMRANIVLNVNAIGTYDSFVDTVAVLRGLGTDSIAAWCLRDENDQVDAKLAPASDVLREMEAHAFFESQLGFPVKVYREETRGYQEGDKLTLFPDGTLSSNWCK